MTKEGYDFYLSKLLKSEGLQIDRQSVLNSTEYESWKRKGSTLKRVKIVG